MMMIDKKILGSTTLSGQDSRKVHLLSFLAHHPRTNLSAIILDIKQAS